MILFLRANFLIVVAFLALLFGVNLPTFSQTTVTASAPVTLCVGSTQTLSPISIAEAPANPNGFSAAQTNATFILTAPSNFEFVSAGSVTYLSGNDIVSTSIQSITGSELTILISVFGNSNQDIFTINNLVLRAISVGAPGDILRTGGSLLVAGGEAVENNGFSYGSLTVNAIPAAPAVTFSPSSYCVGTAITAPTVVGAGLQWWSNAGLTTLIATAIPASPTNVELGFSSAFATVTTVYVTQTVSSCKSLGTAVTLTVNPLPTTANAGVDIDQCNTANFVLAANTATVGTGVWSNVGGQVGLNADTPGSNVSTVTGLLAGNSVTLRWTITNGVCGSTFDEVTLINLLPSETSDVGVGITQCNTSSFTMVAVVPTVGVGVWSLQSGTASITNTALATTTVTGIAA
ncbi:MAG: hypothetical protein IM606_09710, partial [Cytophagales bacterium]|nr:hypothetical protein [Cytophagales bacterium]